MKRTLVAFYLVFNYYSLYSQNVGIGTPSPVTPLHISGNSELLRLQGSFPWLGFMNNTDPTYAGFIYYPDTSLVMGSRSGTNKPLVLAPNNIGLLFATSAQRIGIGNGAPTEKLDVNGNINVTGTIKANGMDGNAGQILMKNSSGTLAWGDMCEYKNFVVFTSGSFASWTIPNGTSKLWVELWGGGASGSAYIGGGGGGYVSAIIEIATPATPGSLSYTVGTGGTGGAGANGTASNVFYSTITLQANGGNGGTFSAGPPQLIGAAFGGDGSATPASFISYIVKRGSPGQSYYSTIQTTPSATYETVYAGRGGNSGNTDATGGGLNQLIINLTTGSALKWSSAVGNGIVPGGGGSSGVTPLSGTIFSSLGSTGANGLVIVHY
jgi:hypothetical protein